MSRVKRKPGPTPIEHTCLLLNTTKKEYEEFEQWAIEGDQKKIDLFRRMMEDERGRRSEKAREV